MADHILYKKSVHVLNLLTNVWNTVNESEWLWFRDFGHILWVIVLIPSFPASNSSEYPPVLSADSPSLLPPGTRVVRPDARVQLEPHHPDSKRWPRRPGCPKEARDPVGGERNEGEMPPSFQSVLAWAWERERLLNNQRSSMYVMFSFLLCGHISLSPLCKHWLTFLKASTASNVI